MSVTTKTVTEIKCDLCGRECETQQWQPTDVYGGDDVRGPIPYHTVTLRAFRTSEKDPKTKTMIVGLCCQGQSFMVLVKKADSEESFGWKTY